MPQSNQLIVSLAILLVDWDQGKGYLDNFVPFIGQCILALKPSVVSVQALQAKLRDDYGLRVPLNTLNSIVKRAARKGYVAKQDNMYVPDYDALVSLDFEKRRQDVLRQHEALTRKFAEFASEKYRMELTPEAAGDLLLAFVRRHDVELLSCILAGESLSIVQDELTEREAYLVAAFVADVLESDPENSGYLDTVIRGHMLSTALFFSDLGRLPSRFRRTTVYFDTALVLRALGYEGQARQSPCRELIELLREAGATIACFSHTRDEVNNVLYACRMSLDPSRSDQGRGPAFRHFHQSGYTPVDLELEMAGLDRRIEALGIRILDKPEHVERHQVDESRLEQALDAEVQYGPDANGARKHDTDCLSAIFRLRKGKSVYQIEECGALFVTANSGVCQVGRTFFVGENYIKEGSIPSSVTDHALTNLLWLKKPMVAPDLPRKYVVAECYAAMEPESGLWQKYLNKIRQLRDREELSPEEYFVLRHTQEARTELMNATTGDEVTLVDGTPLEILQRVVKSRTEEDRTKLAAESARRAETESRLHLAEERYRRREETLDQNAQRMSRWIASIGVRAVFYLLEAFLLAGGIYGLVGPQLGWGNAVLFVAALALVALSVHSLVSGRTVHDWLDRAEGTLSRRIKRSLKSLFFS